MTDTRPQELKEQGVRPRVWFGERWITSVFVPRLDELSLHNGAIYRRNRPIHAVVDGRPHLRVENRVLPARPPGRFRR